MDRDKVTHAVETAFELWIDEYTGCSWFKEDEVRQAKEDAIALLKEQDYRGWLMDMFHKYGRDDLIALLVLHGEENLLADVLKEQEAVVRCKDCKKCDLPEEEPYEDGYCSQCGYVKMDWFYADGERRDTDERQK